MTVSDAIQHIKSNQNVFIHSVSAAPQALIQEMVKQAKRLTNVNIYHLHTEGDAPYVAEEYESNFHVNALFIGANVRKAVQSGRASYIPVFLSEAPQLFRQKIIPLDLALISVSPPDKHGYCSLGTSVDTSLAAVESAKTVIAQVNSFLPRSHGDGLIHIQNIDCVVEKNEAIPEVHTKALDERALKIGENIAALIEDGATLQMGIGTIPDAVLASLTGHKNLGVHTEMFSDGLLPLIEKGIVNGREKFIHPHKIVATFAMGSRKLYDFIDDNPLVQMLDAAFVNDAHIIRKNPKVTAINSAIEVDLSGQVCADSIGTLMYSGVGGQMDFIRAASLSEGGKAIIALPSTTRSGASKIVPFLKQGAGVVTSRAHVHYIVTEYGAVNLYGKSLRERAKLLIGIAHPKHREELEEKAHRL